MNSFEFTEIDYFVGESPVGDFCQIRPVVTDSSVFDNIFITASGIAASFSARGFDHETDTVSIARRSLSLFEILDSGSGEVGVAENDLLAVDALFMRVVLIPTCSTVPENSPRVMESPQFEGLVDKDYEIAEEVAEEEPARRERSLCLRYPDLRQPRRC